MIRREIVSTISSKGQVTIPPEIRKHLNLKKRDKIVFIVEEGGTVRPSAPQYPDIASLRGAAGSLEKLLSWNEVEQIAREDRVES
jgi:AbrB family looped-hinge helix DNA binding protein